MISVLVAVRLREVTAVQEATEVHRRDRRFAWRNAWKNAEVVVVVFALLLLLL